MLTLSAQRCSGAITPGYYSGLLTGGYRVANAQAVPFAIDQPALWFTSCC